MKRTIKKFKVLEATLSKERGDFVLFALFEREDTPNKWDFILSATWLKENKKELSNIVKRLHAKFSSAELLSLSRLLLLKPNDPFVVNINKLIQVEHGEVELINCVINQISIRHAFIISSKLATGANTRVNTQEGKAAG